MPLSCQDGDRAGWRHTMDDGELVQLHSVHPGGEYQRCDLIPAG
jgi:hypothetical protein